MTDHGACVHHEYKLKNQDKSFLRISKINDRKFQFFIKKNKTLIYNNHFNFYIYENLNKKLFTFIFLIKIIIKVFIN
jgi:hypothetical protein